MWLRRMWYQDAFDAFEKEDNTLFPKKNGILFVGSSIFRRYGMQLYGIVTIDLLLVASTISNILLTLLAIITDGKHCVSKCIL